LAADGHAQCVLRRAAAENLLVLGQQRELRNRMLASALAALPSWVAPASLDITLLDGLAPDMPGGRMLLMACEQLAARGACVRMARDGTLEAALSALAQSLSPSLTAYSSSADAIRTRLLILAEPDALTPLQLPPDAFAPPATGTAAQLRALLMRGPQQGVHVIVTASGLAAMGTVLSPVRELRYFNHRAVQPLSDEDSMTVLSSLAAARIGTQTDHPFAALLADQSQVGRGVLLCSYAADTDVNAPQDIDALRECFSTLGGKRAQANVA